MQTNALQDQIDNLKVVIESLLSVLHPGVVGLISIHHGEDACNKACVAITTAKETITET